jgi:ADP-ribosylglycohydrolase
MSSVTMKNKFRGAILGTAIGDALGAPMESMNKVEIAKQISVLNGYVNIIRPAGHRTFSRKPGEWTDDTQLMKPIAASIANKLCIDPQDIAERTCEVYRTEELRGWSKSTIKAVSKLATGVPWQFAAQDSIGIGNGVAMKAAPLGLFLSKSTDVNTTYNDVISVGKITHHEPGIIAGVLQSVLLSFATNGIRRRSYILKELTNIEFKLFGITSFTKKLKKATKFKSIEHIGEFSGLSAKADESWVAVAAMYLKTRNKIQAIDNLFKIALLGGDTDTCCAMYAALIGARWGIGIFPKNLLSNLEDFESIMKLSDQLYISLNGNAKK